MRKVSLDYNFVMKSNLDDGLNMDELESELKLAEEGLNGLNGMVESNEVGFPKLVDLDDSEIGQLATAVVDARGVESAKEALANLYIAVMPTLNLDDDDDDLY